jgi:hypothetical protein
MGKHFKNMQLFTKIHYGTVISTTNQTICSKYRGTTTNMQRQPRSQALPYLVPKEGRAWERGSCRGRRHNIDCITFRAARVSYRNIRPNFLRLIDKYFQATILVNPKHACQVFAKKRSILLPNFSPNCNHENKF